MVGDGCGVSDVVRCCFETAVVAELNSEDGVTGATKSVIDVLSVLGEGTKG
jgi:hypothetical protein